MLPELIITKYVLLTGGRAAGWAAILTFNKAPSCSSSQGVY